MIHYSLKQFTAIIEFVLKVNLSLIAQSEQLPEGYIVDMDKSYIDVFKDGKVCIQMFPVTSA